MDASPFFSGAALAFSISGDGVSIDPATGLVTISLDALRDGAAIRLVAENSGGRAELGFTLKVTPPAVAPVLHSRAGAVGARSRGRAAGARSRGLVGRAGAGSGGAVALRRRRDRRRDGRTTSPPAPPRTGPRWPRG